MSVDRQSDGSDYESEMVPAVLARSLAEAEVYCELLGDHDIPAIIGDDVCNASTEDDEGDEDDIPIHPTGMTHSVPILVPETLLDDAGEIISQQDDLDELELADDAVDGADDDDEDDHYGFSELDEDPEDLQIEDDLLDDDDDPEDDEF